MSSFKERWNIKSNWQLFVIIVVFAVTGSSAAYLSKPILSLFGIVKGSVSNWLYYPLYILLIFPVYQVLLVSFGFIFGQFTFFWAFEKKMLKSMGLGFLVKDKKNLE
ncbi:MAG: diacylglyceryl transferase [Flavobacterium sp.]|nr:diacylglyceryl transferase [Flavobacterium sp.]